MKILLVEDEAKLAAHVGLALERQGHEVRIINDGVEAIDAALEALIRDAGLVETAGTYSMVMTRTAKRGSASVLDRLGGL